MNWKYFTGAAIFVAVLLLPYAPLPSILLGLVIAAGAHWLLERRAGSASRKPSA